MSNELFDSGKSIVRLHLLDENEEWIAGQDYNYSDKDADDLFSALHSIAEHFDTRPVGFSKKEIYKTDK